MTAADVAVPDLDTWLQTAGYTHSRSFENVVEHIFLSELLQECLFRERRLCEVARAEVDAAGYDLILGMGGEIRHVQLKATRKTGATRKVTINRALESCIGGCVVWIRYHVQPERRRAELTYLFREATDLPEAAARNPRTKKERPRACELKPSDFDPVSGIEELVHRLFPRSRRVGT